MLNAFAGGGGSGGGWTGNGNWGNSGGGGGGGGGGQCFAQKSTEAPSAPQSAWQSTWLSSSPGTYVEQRSISVFTEKQERTVQGDKLIQTCVLTLPPEGSVQVHCKPAQRFDLFYGTTRDKAETIVKNGLGSEAKGMRIDLTTEADAVRNANQDTAEPGVVFMCVATGNQPLNADIRTWTLDMTDNNVQLVAWHYTNDQIYYPMDLLPSERAELESTLGRANEIKFTPMPESELMKQGEVDAIQLLTADLAVEHPGSLQNAALICKRDQDVEEEAKELGQQTERIFKFTSNIVKLQKDILSSADKHGHDYVNPHFVVHSQIAEILAGKCLVQEGVTMAARVWAQETYEDYCKSMPHTDHGKLLGAFNLTEEKRGIQLEQILIEIGSQ